MKKSRKLVIVLVAILVATGIGFGMNFFSWEKSNIMQKQTMTVNGGLNVVDITDLKNVVPGDELCGAINFKIDSTATSLLRVKVDTVIDDVVDNVYDIKIIDNSKWIKSNDGYYYYKEGVSDATKTVEFAKNVTFDLSQKSEPNLYQNKEIDVKIEAEMVQAKHDGYEKWGIEQGHSAYDTLKKISDDEKTEIINNEE